jgi:hypothetical protein
MPKTIISRYHNVPGEHCGSVAMRNLIHFYCHRDLPEEIVFGLGSAVDCVFLSSRAFDPPMMMFGRTITMEVDLAQALGVDYRETIEPDDEEAWEIVRQEVVEGRPTMLSGDVLYLDYRKFKVHFPGHRYVLVGFDDETSTAYVADRLAPDFQPCSYSALAKSRNPPDTFSTYNLWGKFHDTTIAHSLEAACALALRKNVDRMLGRDSSQADLLKVAGGGQEFVLETGLNGIAALAGALARGHGGFTASYLSQTIEKFGTGGGNFRKMYSGFLAWARETTPDLVPPQAPTLAARAAASWTDLSVTLEAASKEPGVESHWKRASEQARAIHRMETELFEALGEATAKR